MPAISPFKWLVWGLFLNVHGKGHIRTHWTTHQAPIICRYTPTPGFFWLQLARDVLRTDSTLLRQVLVSVHLPLTSRCGCPLYPLVGHTHHFCLTNRQSSPLKLPEAQAQVAHETLYRTLTTLYLCGYVMFLKKCTTEST